MRSIVRGVVALVAAFCIINAVKAAPTIVSPADYACVRTLTDTMKNLISPLNSNVSIFSSKNTTERSNYQTEYFYNNSVPVGLSWSGTTGNCTVKVWRTNGGSESAPFFSETVSGTSTECYNLEVGCNYTWKVTDSQGNSAVGHFFTEDQAPRIIRGRRSNFTYSSGADCSNGRDIGGWATTNGKRVKQGKIYRSGQLEYCSFKEGSGIYQKMDMLYDVLGIRVDVDLRTVNNVSAFADWKAEWNNNQPFDNPCVSSGIGPDVERFTIEWATLGKGPSDGNPYVYDGKYGCQFPSYSALYNSMSIDYKVGNTTKTYTQTANQNKIAVWAAFNRIYQAVVVDKEPVIFHCSHGKDRTGSLAAVIHGLLGVSEADIKRDFATAWFCNPDYTFTQTSMNTMLTGLKNLDTASTKTLAGGCEKYLISCATLAGDTAGATKVAAFKAAMLEDVETPEGNVVTPEPDEDTFVYTHYYWRSPSDGGSISSQYNTGPWFTSLNDNSLMTPETQPILYSGTKWDSVRGSYSHCYNFITTSTKKYARTSNAGNPIMVGKLVFDAANGGGIKAGATNFKPFFTSEGHTVSDRTIIEHRGGLVEFDNVDIYLTQWGKDKYTSGRVSAYDGTASVDIWANATMRVKDFISVSPEKTYLKFLSGNSNNARLESLEHDDTSYPYNSFGWFTGGAAGTKQYIKVQGAYPLKFSASGKTSGVAGSLGLEFELGANNKTTTAAMLQVTGSLNINAGSTITVNAGGKGAGTYKLVSAGTLNDYANLDLRSNYTVTNCKSGYYGTIVKSGNNINLTIQEGTPPAEDEGLIDIESDGDWGYRLNIGNEIVLAFTNHTKSVNWQVPSKLENVQFLVVGGGGGGGADSDNGNTHGGAGGGGGGVVTGLVDFAENSVVTITVGAGGNGGVRATQGGTNNKYGAAFSGKASSINVDGAEYVWAAGGGGDNGADESTNASKTKGNVGNDGGSSAGSRPGQTGRGAVIAPRVASVSDIKYADKSFGRQGGAGYYVTPADDSNTYWGYFSAAGGGGGATQAGGSAVDYTNAGNGGEGLLSSITGQAVVYGSGGGGATLNGTNGGKGGTGAGDGNTADVANGTASMDALPNQGGGGGGGARAIKTNSSGVGVGGNGGSGIVVLRYVDPDYSDSQINPTEYGAADSAASTYTWIGYTGPWMYTTNWTATASGTHGVPNNGTYATADFPATLVNAFTCTLNQNVSVNKAEFNSPNMTFVLDNALLTLKGKVDSYAACDFGDGENDNSTIELRGANAGIVSDTKEVRLNFGYRHEEVTPTGTVTVRFVVPETGWESDARLKATGTDSKVVFYANSKLEIDATALGVPAEGTTKTVYLASGTGDDGVYVLSGETNIVCAAGAKGSIKIENKKLVLTVEPDPEGTQPPPADDYWSEIPSLSTNIFNAGTSITVFNGMCENRTVTANYTADDIAALEPGTYTFRATASADGAESLVYEIDFWVLPADFSAENTIVCYGDSITYGAGAVKITVDGRKNYFDGRMEGQTIEGNYPYYLAGMIDSKKYNVINQGTPQQWSDTILTWLGGVDTVSRLPVTLPANGEDTWAPTNIIFTADNPYGVEGGLHFVRTIQYPPYVNGKRNPNNPLNYFAGLATTMYPAFEAYPEPSGINGSMTGWFGNKRVRIHGVEDANLYFSGDNPNGVYCTDHRWQRVSTEGNATTIPANTPFIPDTAIIFKDAISVIYTGTNDEMGKETYNNNKDPDIDHNTYIKMIAGTIAKNPSGRHLVVSTLSLNQRSDESEAAFAKEFGEKYLNLHGMMERYGTLVADKLGITGITAWDATDGTGFLNSDEIHPNEKGYQVIAYFINQKLIDLKYIEGVRDDDIVFGDGNTDDPGEDTPPVESVVVTNAMPEASWGYTVSGLGDNRNEVAVVFTNENANMTWTVPQNLKNVQFLVVGGGGGGGAVNGDTRTAGAGGGGGGVVTGLVASIEKGVSVTVTVGKGGAAGQMGVAVNGHYAAAVSGTDSAFGYSDKFAVTAYGGGGDDGASSATAAVGYAGQTGGSSAGSRPGCSTETQPKSKESCVVSGDGLIICSEVFGNAGGAGANVLGPFDQYWAAGGGGGAIKAGSAATSWISWDDFDIQPAGKGIRGGDGGAGLQSDITGETLVYGSGGGGGSGAVNEFLGGNGGIGAGSGKTDVNTTSSTTSINALANQGGGGGGGYNEGGTGGSGIVVFRYTVAPESPTVDGRDYDADKVFDAAKVSKPITYPGNPEVTTNTVDGVEVITVTFGGLSDEVPSCYNVTKVADGNGYQLVLAIKDEFKNPVIANSENEDGSITPAIKVEGGKVMIHLEGDQFSGELYYIFKKGGDLTARGAWEVCNMKTETGDVLFDLNANDTAGFFEFIKVSDERVTE